MLCAATSAFIYLHCRALKNSISSAFLRASSSAVADWPARRCIRTSVRENVCNNSKNVKSHVFLKFEKNVKNVKKRRSIAYVQFHRPLNQTITQPLILNYRNQNSVPVPVSHQHHTPCSEMLTQETNMQLTCRSVIVKRL